MNMQTETVMKITAFRTLKIQIIFIRINYDLPAPAYYSNMRTGLWNNSKTLYVLLGVLKYTQKSI